MSSADTDVEILRAGAEAIDELRPLWLAIRDRHGEVMPHLGPVRDDDDSWRVRRGDYEKWLSEPGAFLVVAKRRGQVVGYAMVQSEQEKSATWASGARSGLWGFIESLSVAPDVRGNGIGARLLDAVRTEAAREGFAQLGVGAVSGNAGAIRFYERHGFAHDAVFMVDSEYRAPQT